MTPSARNSADFLEGNVEEENSEGEGKGERGTGSNPMYPSKLVRFAVILRALVIVDRTLKLLDGRVIRVKQF